MRKDDKIVLFDVDFINVRSFHIRSDYETFLNHFSGKGVCNALSKINENGTLPALYYCSSYSFFPAKKEEGGL